MTASARQPPQAGAPFAEARSELAILRSRIPSRAANPAVRSAQRQNEEEAASPGNQSRSARFWKFPSDDSLSRITVYCWPCRNHPAESGTLTFR